jgi:hypothetical protein
MSPKKYLPFIALIIVLALLWRNCNKASNPGATQTSAAVTSAQKLASVDAGSDVPLSADDETVKKTDALLNSISASFHESPELIANATYSAYMYLKRNNNENSNLVLLQHMSNVTPVPGMRYKQMIMQYAAEQSK